MKMHRVSSKERGFKNVDCFCVHSCPC